jgi:hypothetical protein
MVSGCPRSGRHHESGTKDVDIDLILVSYRSSRSLSVWMVAFRWSRCLWDSSKTELVSTIHHTMRRSISEKLSSGPEFCLHWRLDADLKRLGR